MLACVASGMRSSRSSTTTMMGVWAVAIDSSSRNRSTSCAVLAGTVSSARPSAAATCRHTPSSRNHSDMRACSACRSRSTSTAPASPVRRVACSSTDATMDDLLHAWLPWTMSGGVGSGLARFHRYDDTSEPVSGWCVVEAAAAARRRAWWDSIRASSSCGGPRHGSASTSWPSTVHTFCAKSSSASAAAGRPLSVHVTCCRITRSGVAAAVAVVISEARRAREPASRSMYVAARVSDVLMDAMLEMLR